MRSTEEEIVERVLAVRPDLADATVAVVGSRGHGHADVDSDWDLVALVGDDRPEETIEPFPATASFPAPTRTAVTTWRRSRPYGGVEVELLGESARRRREALDLCLWYIEVAQARVLHDGWPGFGAYRDGLARAFSEQRPQRAVSEWARFRLARNETLSSLGRASRSAALLSGAHAVEAAARAYLLWGGEPYPSTKWLRDVVAARGGRELVAAADAILASPDPDDASTRSAR